jgi:hypothetical protein
MTYRIWYKDNWYYILNKNNTKRILEFETLQLAKEQALLNNLPGASIWKLEAAPKVAFE